LVRCSGYVKSLYTTFGRAHANNSTARADPSRTDHGQGDVSFLAIATPGVFGPGYFHELGAVVRAAAAAGGPPDPAAMAEVMRRHGLMPAL
jgi:hypothetical protein